MVWVNDARIPDQSLASRGDIETISFFAYFSLSLSLSLSFIRLTSIPTIVRRFAHHERTSFTQALEYTRGHRYGMTIDNLVYGKSCRKERDQDECDRYVYFIRTNSRVISRSLRS